MINYCDYIEFSIWHCMPVSWVHAWVLIDLCDRRKWRLVSGREMLSSQNECKNQTSWKSRL
jgi:hypothetical protein